MKKDYIESGKIVGTHGVRGGVRIQPWCDTPDFLCDFKKVFFKQKEGYTSVKVCSAKPHGNVVLMELEGIIDMDMAESLRGQIVYLERSSLKLQANQYLICDLIGCEAFDSDSDAKLGIICDVSKTGANDVWHIEREGNEYLIPVIDDVVLGVDIDANKVVIRPLKGIFEE